MRSVAGAVALSFVMGCGATPDTNSQPVRTDSAGVEIVLSSEDHRLLDWRMEEEFSIGGRDEGPEGFYQVFKGGVDVSRDGQIFVLDASHHRVAVFDSSGTPIRVIGKPGGGPGEFQRPVALRLEEDQVVAVLDIGKQALIRFTPDGSPIGQQSVDVLRVGADWHPSASGTYWTLRERATDGAELTTLVHVSAEGDTVALVRHRTSPQTPVRLTSCGIVISLGPLFEPLMRWDVVGDDLAVSHGAGYVVDMFRGTQHMRSVRRNIDPLETTEAMALEGLGEGRTIHSSRGTHVCDAEEELEKRGYANVIPVIDDVALAPDGTLWVQRASLGEDAGSIDLFNPDGGYLGSLTTGELFPVGFLPDGRPLVVIADGFDVERLGVMQLKK